MTVTKKPSLRCQKCDRAMFRARPRGTNWVWKCPKCKGLSEAPGDAQEIAGWKLRIRDKEKEKVRQIAAEELGEAPEGEDAELWAMRRVMTQDFEHDVGPRQTFYRRLYDDEPFRFAKMMQDRETFVKRESESAVVDKDDGVGRSLELAETLLGEVANVETSRP